jgi:hypothetical protein
MVSAGREDHAPADTKHWALSLDGLKGKGSSLCLTLDGKREELNVDFVLSPESFEA